jgi:hypothetical protein
MKEPVTENKQVFIKLEPEDYVDIKKALLEINVSNINMQLISERLKSKSVQEIKERALAKRKMREASEMVHDFVQRLPKVGELGHSVKRRLIRDISDSELSVAPTSPVSRPEKKTSSYMAELEELKRKISSL